MDIQILRDVNPILITFGMSWISCRQNTTKTNSLVDLQQEFLRECNNIPENVISIVVMYKIHRLQEVINTNAGHVRQWLFIIDFVQNMIIDIKTVFFVFLLCNTKSKAVNRRTTRLPKKKAKG
jgi:hypothetical protein